MMAMTHLYFVRHGESEMNMRPDLVGGRSNHVNLTERGIRQAKAFGKWLESSSLRPDVVYFSPAIRTIQTMDYSLEAAGLDGIECIADPRIQELGQGVNEGVLRDVAYPQEILDQIEEETFDFKFEGGESINMVMERKLDFIKDVAVHHPNKTVLVYGHGFAIRSLATAINKLSHYDAVKGLKTPNLSLSHFEVAPTKNIVHEFGQRVINEESV
jgi:broad specificity phosphatase PhoE